MNGFAVRGWCPDAWRPMRAGDGLLVRVRPQLGRLSRTQGLGLCAAALTHGNGRIDATSRGNLQIRGVAEASWRALVDALIAIGLIDPDPVRERRANILVAPEWRAGDDTHRIACGLLARLDDLPDLPGKAGFVIDAGPGPVLGNDPGDFRIERAAGGGLILRGDGRAGGVAIAPGDEVEALIAMARWFVASGGVEAGRMARHAAALPGAGTLLPAAGGAPLRPGRQAGGLALGLPFGRIEAGALADFFERSGAVAVRVTPWRMLVFEGAGSDDAPGFIADPAASLLRIDACVGAPACSQATVGTRDLAERLGPHVAGRLHVSGCAKGCARAAAAADVVLTGRDGHYDLGFGARAGDPPVRAGLDADDVLAVFGAV